MKLATHLSLLLASLTITGSAELLWSSPEARFASWVQEHAKSYDSTKLAQERMRVWIDNDLFIEEHNSRVPAPSYTLGHNQFSDLTLDEFQEYNKLGVHGPGDVRISASRVEILTSRRQQAQLPDTVDWVQAGAVVPVKNQGMCGSCWAFSAICAIEGAHFVDTGVLISLSEQELMDCDPLDLGCGGGLMDNAFLFDENSTGICSDEDYPYKGHKSWIDGCGIKNGLCEGVEHTRVKTFIDVEVSVEGLMAAIAMQPVSVAIEADQRSFQFYKSGVYNDPECGNQLDHGVAAVGYGTSEDGEDYFVVRNSWGPSWGDSGYIKMSRVSENVNGTCGILSAASIPTLRDD